MRHIAAIENRDGVDAQSVLASMAREWRNQGAGVAGIIADSLDPAKSVCSAGFLQDIATGRNFSIHLDTVAADAACHLDALGLDAACAELLPQIAGCDLVILSKFGKSELTYHGLWPAFEAAFAAGKPLLTTVSTKQLPAWKSLMPGAAWVSAEMSSLDTWWRTTRKVALAPTSVSS